MAKEAHRWNWRSPGGGRVIGLDIREEVLAVAREKAIRKGVAEACHFTTKTDELVDGIVSVDAFEPFADPAAMLQMMHDLLRPAGECLVSFGPTWYHPLGGHCSPCSRGRTSRFRKRN